jgi:hypothetical protein
MINLDTTPFDRFLKSTIADRIRHAPVDAPKGSPPVKNDCL